MNRVLSAIIASIVVPMPCAVAVAGQPPADGMPILRIVRQLEQLGYGPVSRISFQGARWQVTAYRLDTPYHLSVDPHSAKILSQRREETAPRPPHDAQPLSRILATLAKSGSTRIRSVTFERRHWQVQSRRADGERWIRVNFRTGEVIRNGKENEKILVLEE